MSAGPDRPDAARAGHLEGTSHVTQDVAGDLPVQGRLVIPADELSWRFSRSAGPGGQSVNTTDSRVELSWDAASSRALSQVQRDRLMTRWPDGTLTVTASVYRSQWQNRRDARARLADAVRRAIAPPRPRRRPTRPTRGAIERRLAAKRRRAETKRRRRVDES